jgi:hypothetical protein
LRKLRTDSISAAIDAMQDAASPLPNVPEHCTLRKEDLAFWRSVVASRARSEWSDNDLVVAAQLARCQADIEVEQKELDNEGTVLLNARGTKVANARVAILENLARREMALMRALRMAGVSGGNTSRDSDNQRILERSSRGIREALLDDDEELLAR